MGSMAALMGSPIHLSITASDGMSAPISIATKKNHKNVSVMQDLISGPMWFAPSPRQILLL